MTNEKFSEKSIREAFPSPRFRVSPQTYEAGEKIRGTTSKGLCYVIEGACRFKGLNQDIELRAGEHGVLEGGSTYLEVLGDSRVVLIKVWDLEALMRERGIAQGSTIPSEIPPLDESSGSP